MECFLEITSLFHGSFRLANQQQPHWNYLGEPQARTQCSDLDQTHTVRPKEHSAATSMKMSSHLRSQLLLSRILSLPWKPPSHAAVTSGQRGELPLARARRAYLTASYLWANDLILSAGMHENLRGKGSGSWLHAAVTSSNGNKVMRRSAPWIGDQPGSPQGTQLRAPTLFWDKATDSAVSSTSIPRSPPMRKGSVSLPKQTIKHLELLHGGHMTLFRAAVPHSVILLSRF
ncbi:hypothetical protein NEUTE1DRAFT_112589 [Neurospora tetrasperma FGSC 2508]|uniref:Uncharacterized protein n=1 Tax=Neurospora tetrasperma (strain FGSC 2508 / ATCC MYA-4615 / P0657) TaxID=510951 RepID=F8MW40_NEUT8|nr:uncharacterized protein NEUTE1DRAFT_112589 [Neurospora tetrasperma FGSC 2508]EGO54035.1 hypothetical protein NEUTE1DRAFT_112589 [Neurospora tetrasperma FGSC 2508]